MIGVIQISGHTLHPRFLDEKSIVLDLGANHGAFSKQILMSFGGRCIAVEGNPFLASKLPKDARLEVISAAVGASDGAVRFSIAENDQCSSVLSPTISATMAVEEVPMISLPTLIRENGWETIDLVKMDIEGAEVMVLDACPDEILLQIGQLAVEFHESLGLTSMSDVFRIAGRLEKLGFIWIRGTFSNYEDNLFINRALCPLSRFELLFIQAVSRYLNGLIRVLRRLTRRVFPHKPVC